METRKEHTYQPIASEREYYDLEHRSEYVKELGSSGDNISVIRKQRSSTACPTRNCWSLLERRAQYSGWMERF